MYSYDRVEQAAEDKALEAVIAHANHNKRLPLDVALFLKQCLKGTEGPPWVVPAKGAVYRGDHTTPQKFFQDVAENLPPKGSKRVTLHLKPGSSWSYDIEQAQYHGTSGTLNPEVEVFYVANASTGTWLDMRVLYQMSQLRGLRGEREVINLDEKVACVAQWALP